MTKSHTKYSKSTWNLSPLFSSDNDPLMQAHLKEVSERSYRFINKWKDRKDYLSDPAILKEALDEYENWEANTGLAGKEGYYFILRAFQDQSDPKLKAKYNKSLDFQKRILTDIHFFELRLGKVPENGQKKFLKSSLLKEYRHFLEQLFASAKYHLSEAEEKILVLKGQTSHSNWVKMTSDFLTREERNVLDSEGKKTRKGFTEIQFLMSNKTKKIRDTAAEAFNEILQKYVDIAETEINSILGNKKVDDQLRKLPRPDTARHIEDDIDTEIVDVLVESVAKRYNIARQYYKLKAELFGVNKLKYHERNVEYGKATKKYKFDEAFSLIYKVFGNLDPEFAKTIKDFKDKGQLDIYPRRSKHGGAFCISVMISLPVYILLNHTDELADVTTMAHEFGHGINDVLVNGKQNALNADIPLSTAEVASTFMEDFVFQELLKEANDELKLQLMMSKLNSEISTISRQIACYKFEQELHQQYRERGYLSKNEIGKLFQKHMKTYMGKYVEQSPGSENWWVYWSHIRRFFYVYTYASGLLISKSMQRMVRQNPKNIAKVKEFLSAGSMASPKDIFAGMGIDIAKKAFWDKGLNEVENLLKETTKLAKTLGKI